MKALIACLGVLGLLPLGVLAAGFDDWTPASPLIFMATVVEANASTQPDLMPSTRTIVVRVERVFRSKAILGSLVGKRITVLKATAWKSPVGQRFYFFTNSLIYGESLALREIGHYAEAAIPAAEIPGRISAALARDEDRRLKARLDGAELVVVGKVSAVSPVPEPDARVPRAPEPRAPGWWQARVKVESVEKGRLEGDTVTVVFPTGRSWTGFPKFDRDQEGVWLLRREQLKALPAGRPLTALDTGDFSGTESVDRIRKLLRATK